MKRLAILLMLTGVFTMSHLKTMAQDEEVATEETAAPEAAVEETKEEAKPKIKTDFSDSKPNIGKSNLDETKTKGDTSTNKNIQSGNITDNNKGKGKTVQPTSKPKSDTKKVKVETKDIDKTNFNIGKKADFSNKGNLTDEQITDVVATESENPLEIAQEIKRIRDLNEESATVTETTKESAIAQALNGIQVDKESFANTDDRNNISNVNPNYFSKRNKKGRIKSIDEIRELAQQYTNEEVSMQDITDFMKENKNPNTFSKNKNKINTADIEFRFEELTGLKPTKSNIDKVLNSPENDSKRIGEKTRSFANKILGSENTSQLVLDKFRKMDINFDTENQDKVIEVADKIIADLGIIDAYSLTQDGQIRGGAKTYIEVKYSEDLNTQINEAIDKKDMATATNLADKLSKIDAEFAKELTLKGQESAMLFKIYNVSDRRFNTEYIILKLEKQYGKEFPAHLVSRLRNQKKQLDKQKKRIEKLEKENGSQEEINSFENIKSEVKRTKGQPNKESYTQKELDAKIKEAKKEWEDDNLGFEIPQIKTQKKKSEILKQIEEVKNKWKEAGKGDTLNSSIPYAKQLLNATPEIIKLAKLYAEIGGLRTVEIINNIKEVFNDIKESDIKSVLKNEFRKNTKKVKESTKRKIYISLLNKKIDFLDEQIENKERVRVENKDKYADDSEIIQLRKLKEEKEIELEKIDPRISNHKRLKNQLENTQKSLDEYQRKIDEQDFSKKGREDKKIIDVNLRNLKAKRDSKKKEYESAKKSYNNSLIKDEQRLVNQIYKREIALEKTLEKIKSDVKNNPKKQELWSPKISELQNEITKAKKDKKNIYSSIKRIEMDSENGINIPVEILYNLIEGGVDNIVDLTTKVKEIIQEDYHNVTDREVRDAITGYGKKINENGNMLRKILGSLKIDGTQLSKLEDLDRGKLPKKKRNGVNYTEQQKKNIREIQRKLKEIPLDDTIDKESYYKTALESYKTRLEGQIKELTDAIKSNKQIVSKGNKIKLDERAEELKSELKLAREEYNQTFKDTDLSNQKRIESVLNRKENQLKKLSQRLSDLKEFGKVDEKSTKKVTSTEIEKLDADIKKIREEYNQTLEDVGIAEQKRIERKKKYLKTREEYYRDRLKRKDFAKNRPRPLISEENLLQEEVKLMEIKKKYDDALLEYEKSNMGKTEKVLNYVLDILNIPKGLKASIDLSAPLRQGATLGSRNPKQFQNAMIEMHKSFGEKGFKESMAKISTHKDYPLMIKAGLELTEVDGGVNKAEERFLSNLVNKKLNVKGKNVNIFGLGLEFSERTYTSFLNNLRAEVFIKHAELMKATGITQSENPQAYKDLAKLVNFATGRGKLGKDENINKALNLVFFSPRMITAMGGMLKLASGYKTEPYVRKEARKTLASFVAYQFLVKAMLGLTYAGLQGLFSDEDEEIENALPWEFFNPLDTDFGKLKIGDTRYQTSAGWEIALRTIARTVYGEKISNGKITELNKGFKSSRWDEPMNFFFNKFSPTMRYIYSAGADVNPVDNFKKGGFLEATTLEHIESLTVPLTIAGAYQDFTDEKTPAIKALFNLSLNMYGIGSQTYDGKNKK